MITKSLGLYTDYYELTMAQGYFLEGRKNATSVFDYFFRKLPFGGGYLVFAGLGDLVNAIDNFRFDKDDIEFLREKGFHPDFLKYLSSFRFKGNLYSPDEGEIIFPNEPVIRIEGTIIEAQLIESILLNLINFESLIATKASRIRRVAGDRIFIDFGMRRAHGFGALHASRASVIGGADRTSNVMSAKLYGLKPSGTQGHSWIESFETELQAFRKFAEHYPDNCVLLVDTYDTLRSGIPNAITVAKEMEKRGKRLAGIRLDSGDLAYLSKRARQKLDQEGLDYVKIVASNQLDEYIIKSLLEQGAPLDAFGVGTRLAIGKEDGAVDGVYKLVMYDGQPRLKISDNIEKIILPGIKKILRFSNGEGLFRADGVFLENENSAEKIFHPNFPDKETLLAEFSSEELLKPVIVNGDLVKPMATEEKAAEYLQQRLTQLPEEHKRFEYPHIYRVGIGPGLLDLRGKMIQEIKDQF